MCRQWYGLLAALALGLLVPGSVVLLLDVGLARGLPLAQASSTVRYVATSGADTGDCTNSAAPCRTVQFAVDQTADGDEILVATGVYTGVQTRVEGTQMVYLNRSVTLRGGYTTTNWAASYPVTQPTTLDAQGLGRVLYIDGASGAPTIEGFRITGGGNVGAGAGVYVFESAAVLRDNVIHNNATTGTGSGGGLYLDYSPISLTANTFLSNTATYGGGLYLYSSAATFVANTMLSNTASNAGGGLYLASSAATFISNTVQANSSPNAAGFYLRFSDATLVANSILSNTATFDGGGVRLDSSSARLSDNLIQGNRAGAGGGVLTMRFSGYSSGSPILSRNVIRGNSATGDGGGLYLNNYPLNASEVVRPELEDNLIQGNTASDQGGGVYSKGGDPVFRSNVVVDNSAGSSYGGSGIHLSSHDQTTPPTTNTFLHNTIARNSGGAGAGVYVWESTGRPVTATFENTIIFSHTVGITNVQGLATVELTRTLWENNVTDHSSSVTDTLPVPGSAALAADGYHLTAGSAAIDAGGGQALSAGLDQDVDGQPRPAGFGFDLGADEYPDTALVLAKTPSSATLEPGATVTYTISVTVANDAANGLLVTDTLPTWQQATAAATSHGVATLQPGWGGGALFDVGMVPTATTVYLTLTAQVSTTAALAEVPFTMRNSVAARSDEAVNLTYADTSYQYCRAIVNDNTAVRYDSVQAAINAASPGDVVNVAGYCPGNTSLTKSVELRGGYTQDDWAVPDPTRTRTVLDAQGQGRVLYISGASITPTVEGFRIRGGGNVSQGAGVYVDRSAATLRDNVIENNATTGSSGTGGGVYVYFAEQATLTGNTIQRNAANYGGGVRLIRSPATVASNAILSNTAAMQGGGLRLDSSDARISGNLIQGNSAGSGGGIRVGQYTSSYSSGSPILSRNIISGNSATGDGGGLFFDNLPQNASSVVRPELDGNRIQGNTSGTSGGGLFSRGGDPVFRSNVVVDNRAGQQGSGIYLTSQTSNSFPITNTFLHTTIARNSGGDGSGVYASAGAGKILTATFENTIVFSHTLGVKNGGGPATVALTRTLWQSNVADYSGSVSDTLPITGSAAFATDGYHLGAGSAAIDAGISTVAQTDVDGQPRAMGPSTDLGADEYAYVANLSLTKARPGSGPVDSGRAITFTLAISNAGPWSPADVRLVDVVTPTAAVAALTATTPGGACTTSGAELTCSLDDVPTDTVRLVSVVLTTSVGYGGVLTNSATVAPADAVDTDDADNVGGPVTATVVYVPPTPELGVGKIGPAYAQPGQTAVYTITWQNTDILTAANTSLVDTLPMGATYAGGSMEPAIRSGQVLTWSLGAVAPGASGTYTVLVALDSSLSGGTVLTNSVQITTTTAGDPPENNTAVVTTPVLDLGAASLLLRHQAYPTAAPTSEYTVYSYTILVSNTGALERDLALENPIPTGARYVAGSATATQGVAGFVAATNKVTWNGRLAPGQQVLVDFSVQITACAGVARGVLRNAVQVTAAGSSYVWTDVRDTSILCPDLTVAVTAPGHVPVGADGTAIYSATIRYTNNRTTSSLGESSRAATARLVATLEGAAHFQSASPAASDGSGPTLWAWDLGELAPGAEGEIAIAVAVDDWFRAGYRLAAAIDWVALQPPEPPDDWDEANNSSSELTYPLAIRLETRTEIGRPTFRANGMSESVLFYVRYVYTNTDPALPEVISLTIDDAWPQQLAYGSQSSDPPMSLAEVGPTLLRWQSLVSLAVGDAGWVQVRGVADASIPVSTTLLNQLELRYRLADGQVYIERVTIQDIVPPLPPLIVAPENGEVCPGPLDITGVAQGGSVDVYVNGVYETTAEVGAQGRFTTTIRPNQGTYRIYAMGSSTSAPSNVVEVTVPNAASAFWCPQKSMWRAEFNSGPRQGQQLAFRFRDANGKLSTKDWRISLPPNLRNIQLSIWSCGCPNREDFQTFTVIADGRTYEQRGSGAAQFFDFNISSARRSVVFEKKCEAEQWPDEDDDTPTSPITETQRLRGGGEVLIDPDGYVFDVEKGLQVAGTTFEGAPIYANTLQGVTVTAYVSMTQLGAWVPWPAHLYENQINPQVTGPDGYFAFFTPPGFYYLQVDAIPGYQSWRSPVVQVITEVVHVNVPLTPLAGGDVYTVTLTPEGLSLGIVTVPPGSSVAWVSTLTSTATLTEVASYTDNPVLRPRSALDPLASTLGWDGGMLAPGQVYRRKFTEPGIYAYADGLGRSGQVIVTGVATEAPATPPSLVAIAGPTEGNVGVVYSFVATVTPLTATQPITYVWAASGQSPVTQTVGISDTVAFTWTTTGTQQIAVAAINSGGASIGSQDITIGETSRYRIFLPGVFRSVQSVTAGW